MPCNGLTLAVLIGSEPHGVGGGSCLSQFGHELCLVVGNFVDGVEIVVDVDTEAFFLEVADMSVARHHTVVVAEEFFDGLGFGRGLYYDKIMWFAHSQFGFVAAKLSKKFVKVQKCP